MSTQNLPSVLDAVVSGRNHLKFPHSFVITYISAALYTETLNLTIINFNPS